MAMLVGSGGIDAPPKRGAGLVGRKFEGAGHFILKTSAGPARVLAWTGGLRHARFHIADRWNVQ
jgi:hypothetical protein